MSAAAIDTRLHPLTALAAARRLKANPEDTSQVFVIFRALRGKSGLAAFNRFRDNAVGRQVLAERRVLLDRLSDTAGLAALPEGSVGRAYLHFMQSENLSAAGLVEASNWDNDPVPADVGLFRARMRDAHDLTHILTGYGRDPLGEMCLLAFMNRHSRNLGQLLIIAMNWTRLGTRARAAIREARRNGKKAAWMMALDYEALLARPLADARRELGIAEPALYQEIMP
jgi:ubiquinone biosynthesis protein COQ4